VLDDEFVGLRGGKAGLQKVTKFCEERGFAGELVHLAVQLLEFDDLLGEFNPAAKGENCEADGQNDGDDDGFVELGVAMAADPVG
jgi:hypothetical protein